MSNIIRVAVLSDLHPTDGSDQKNGSHLQMNGPESPEQNPVVGLKKLVESEGLKANIVICPGDIGNQGDPQTISYGWTKLNYIKDFINAERLIVVPGNHDHDSRAIHNKFDPKYILQELDPPFPSPEYENNTHFWAWHWNIIDHDDYRILIFNSSAYHGMNKEFLHGRISTKAIQSIKDKLAGLPEKKLNIFVCHHHPHKQEDIDFEDYEAMDGGQKLISVLDNTNNGSWIIIHGHKHYPCISYAQGTSSSPIVFSSGSFSAYLLPFHSKTV
ncbi:metallophosphoesterase [Methylobacter sp.]|uniref:metallophosphoesterase family protein n=1 Tax=Methylobacter sp. TaxID=2051955 RepID=UPI002489A32D|nr:metallophosphoesterase [Methylobacter sp.]MDI1279525.1 metallophosphoesterase [Methylobacter sp.]MDI1360277.1 metallophosphoesterase [Methylobacter sp.]